MKLKPYQKYKDSGIEWIGEIPEEWEIRKVKHFSNSVAGGTPETTNSAYWDGNVPWLPSGMIHDGIIKEEEVETFITIEGLTNSSTKWIKKDSVLVALTGATCANIAYLTFKSTANQSVIGIECNNKTHSKYIFYYLLSQREQILLNQTGGAQAGINKDDVKNLICAYPEKKDQVLVANFLDYKISKISKTIEADKKLIEFLKEKRTALINHVVTKGLNSKAKMKDSGIDWIGEVPEGWEVRKIKNSCDIKAQYGAGCEPEDNEKRLDHRYIRITDIDELGRLRKDSFAYLSKENAAGYILKEGDVLFARSGATVGKSYYYLIEDGSCAYAGYLIRYKTNKVLNSKYLFYYTLSDSYSGWIKRTLVQSTIENVSAEKYNEMFLPIPSLSEQLQIVEYLDQETSNIDQTIKKIEEKIELLEEYKKSLIHHVVTGKVDVREAVA